MKFTKDNFLKYATIILFLGFIFIFPIINIVTPDKKVSQVENKILAQLPKLSMDSISNGSFMKNFDKYSADQFPFRTDFIEIKNSYSYAIGNREFRDIYIGKDGRLMEKFIFNKDIIDKNISQVTIFARDLYNRVGVSSRLMIIPTSIAFYGDTLPKYAIYDDEKDVLGYIENLIVSNKEVNNNIDKSDYDTYIDFYTPYNILNNNKDDYIYFNTDHHWTQLGAYLAYKDMYHMDIKNTPTKVAEGFYGSYYSKALLPQIKDDNIYAYKDFDDFKVSIDLDKSFDTLYDDSKLDGKNKYQYFLHGDPAIAVINGNPKISKEILIFKDSFAHNFVPFLTSNYSKIHIVDPRYYNMDVYKYLEENSRISEVLFINNLETINSSEFYKKFA
ncbi:hypothetical protein CHL78_009225 [Romboutsia weinsteinii]|uniref:DHHW protein n=1 Tax=Romboutsia weinsteinii TaxID=2020949 RepID=A0A371J3Y1_9FIRM|nr:DHHW family protein [Romboutsia weinsteinii]RDY27388.1 hypothetical protein CHL78_009225 [Romboutsia weinsteinii]